MVGDRGYGDWRLWLLAILTALVVQAAMGWLYDPAHGLVMPALLPWECTRLLVGSCQPPAGEAAGLRVGHPLAGRLP
jgi:hypothetical protein